MTRLPDWEARLSAYVAAVRDRPFEWGEHDCSLFAASSAEAMTGTDLAAAYRGAYSDREGAAVALRKHGAGTLLRTLSAALERRKPSKARRGDFMWFKGAVGVCMGRDALFVGEEHLANAAGVPPRIGLIAIPRALCTKAWAV